jgi:hydrogenase nickel incorporation protein HypA/HybF
MILEIIDEQVLKLNCTRVKTIYLELGAIAAIDKSALIFGFEAVSKGTVAENASLEWIDIEGLAFCNHCQKKVKLKHYYDGCESCGQFALQIIQGEALQVKSIEVE